MTQQQIATLLPATCSCAVAGSDGKKNEQGTNLGDQREIQRGSHGAFD
jgi:hypothetical protein